MKIWRAMRDRLLAMASRFGDSLRRRFVDAVYQIRSDVDLQRLATICCVGSVLILCGSCRKSIITGSESVSECPII